MTLILGSVTAGVILWNFRYRRVWQQSRAKKWSQSDGHFSSGEVITMKAKRGSGSPCGCRLDWQKPWNFSKRFSSFALSGPLI